MVQVSGLGQARVSGMVTTITILGFTKLVIFKTKGLREVLLKGNGYGRTRDSISHRSCAGIGAGDSTGGGRVAPTTVGTGHGKGTLKLDIQFYEIK